MKEQDLPNLMQETPETLSQSFANDVYETIAAVVSDPASDTLKGLIVGLQLSAQTIFTQMLFGKLEIELGYIILEAIKKDTIDTLCNT